MRLKRAELLIAVGKHAEALELLYALRFELPETSSQYFDACKLISVAYAGQKKWREAAEYPEFVLLTAGESRLVRERWPEMKEFLKACYKNGVPCPAAAKKVIGQ